MASGDVCEQWLNPSGSPAISAFWFHGLEAAQIAVSPVFPPGSIGGGRLKELVKEGSRKGFYGRLTAVWAA
jgi:hypothetical protein